VGTPENQNGVGPGQGGTVGTTASINGNLPYASYLQDGATTTLPMSQNSDVTIFETTSEVKVSTTAFSAQNGLGDIIYNQITKSGTDKFHGALTTPSPTTTRCRQYSQSGRTMACSSA